MSGQDGRWQEGPTRAACASTKTPAPWGVQVCKVGTIRHGPMVLRTRANTLHPRKPLVSYVMFFGWCFCMYNVGHTESRQPEPRRHIVQHFELAACGDGVPCGVPFVCRGLLDRRRHSLGGLGWGLVQRGSNFMSAGG